MDWIDTLSPKEREVELARRAEAKQLEDEFVADILSECEELSTSTDLIILNKHNLKTLLRSCIILNNYCDHSESPVDKVLAEVFPHE